MGTRFLYILRNAAMVACLLAVLIFIWTEQVDWFYRIVISATVVYISKLAEDDSKNG